MTTDINQTYRELLDKADPNVLANIFADMKMGLVCSPIKATFTGLASAAAQNVTTAAAKAAATLVGVELKTGELLPPIGVPVAVRVTAGAAAAGLRQVGDSGATPSATVATLSDDGKTLTFEAGVTGFVLYYMPRSSVAMTADTDFVAPG